MRQIFILSFTIALLLVVTVEGQRFRQVCQPNSFFKMECNNCRCNSDGTDMACTKKACFPNYEGSSEPVRVNKNKSKKICEPGTYFKLDCNDCRCNGDGTNAACTLKACPRP